MGRRFDYVVTARHNLEMIAGDSIFLRANKVGGGSELVKTSRGDWHFIPDKKGQQYIDVAVMPVSAPVAVRGSTLDVLNIPVAATVDQDVAANCDLVAGAPIVAIGLFTSHHGEAPHNIPTVRQGHIATMRDAANPVPTSRGDMDAYLVELRSLGGLSGSPALLAVEPAWFLANKRRMPPDGSRPFYSHRPGARALCDQGSA